MFMLYVAILVFLLVVIMFCVALNRGNMKVFDFNKYFPDEASCRRAFKEMRDKEDVMC